MANTTLHREFVLWKYAGTMMAGDEEERRENTSFTEWCIDKIRQLDGPDRGLDAEIAIATSWQLPAPMGDCKARLSLVNHLASEPLKLGQYWLHQMSGASLQTAPEFTASAERAAAMLAEQVAA